MKHPNTLVLLRAARIRVLAEIDLAILHYQTDRAPAANDDLFAAVESLAFLIETLDQEQPPCESPSCITSNANPAGPGATKTPTVSLPHSMPSFSRRSPSLDGVRPANEITSGH